MSAADNFLKKINDIKNEDDLNKVAKDVREYFMARARVQKPKITRSKKKSLVNRDNPHEIRGLFSVQQHRAVQEILFGPSYYCPIDQQKISNQCMKLEHKKDVPTKISDLSLELWPTSLPSDCHNDRLVQNFTPNEVRTKLNHKIYDKLSNSKSVGIDRIKYQDYRKVDPDCQILAALFNVCLDFGRIPEIWKEIYSVLVKKVKSGDDYEIENWRLVTMHNTVAKLFYSLIASRLIVWAQNTNRLSPSQKGILLTNAACEVSFALQECKRFAQRCKKDLAVAFLDFKNASDTIPREAVLHSVKKHSVPLEISELIQKALDGAEFKVRTQDGLTKPIPIRKGLPQGLPLNPILVDLTIEPILRKLESARNDSFKFFSLKINHFVIPDEFILIAESTRKLQNLLNLVEETAKLIGLKFNIDKCSTYHYSSKDNDDQSHKKKFSFSKQNLKIATEDQISEYFGVRQGLSIGQDGIPTIDEMLDSLKKIDESHLDSFGKLTSIQTFILPRVENCLRGLQEFNEDTIKAADEELKNKIKIWLQLPENTNDEAIVYHVSKMDVKDKVQYLPFIDLFHIMKIIHAYKMLNSKDEVIRSIALDSLQIDVKDSITKVSKNNLSHKNLANFLSGTLETKVIQSNTLWQVVRKSTLKLKPKINLKWQVDENDKFQLTMKSLKVKKPMRKPRDTEEKLKAVLIEYYINFVDKKNGKK